jgi:NAD(P)-dependent dehydrogenase (short-subunit alcohol dehydrogenase family)
MSAEVAPDLRIASLFDVAGRVVVITGGSRGIGYMIADSFVQNGARVYITARKREACEEAAAKLSAYGHCVAVVCDVADPHGRATLVNAIGQREGRTDVLINNAGATWGAPFHEYPQSGFDKVLDTNLKAPFFLTQAFLSLLKAGATRARPSCVINIGSIDGINVPRLAPNYAYGPSKAAIHHLTRVLAVLLAREGILVNSIAPGMFESKMTEWTLSTHRDAVVARNPVGRIGAPADIAGLAIYLASPASAYLNGTVIPLDGGTSVENGNMMPN